MNRGTRTLLQRALFVIILLSPVMPAIAHRSGRDLPNSKNGFDSAQFYIDSPSPYTASPLTDSSTGSTKSQIQIHVNVALFSGYTQDSKGNPTIVGQPGYTLLTFTLSNQVAADYIVGVAIASTANRPTLQNAGYMIEGSASGTDIYTVPAMQNGLAFLANDPTGTMPYNTQYPCDTFSFSCIVDAASAIDGADGNVSFWPMGPQSPLDTQPPAPKLTEADVLLAGFPDKSALTLPGLSFSSQTVLNGL